MSKRVFISHKNTDAVLATRVALRLRMNGLETYLDIIDDTLMKDGPDLADLLLERMSKCDQLIAIVSESTKTSWWVPWEIGVGSEKGFLMASYSERYVSLPSYLEKWPDLHSDSDIDLYCRLSGATEAQIRNRTRTVLSSEGQMDIRKSEAFSFHKALRTELKRFR